MSQKTGILLILAIGTLVYINALFNGFVWDDEEQILQNRAVHSLKNIPQIISGATFNSGGGELSGYFFRPLLTFTLMANYAIWGPHPFGFHLFQTAFHILNGVLVFKILNLLSRKPNMLVSTFASILFLVHPAINEAVVYISALSEVMYTFLSLTVLYLISKRGHSLNFKLLVAPVIFASLLYKESSMATVPIILAYICLFQKKHIREWVLVLSSVLITYVLLRLAVGSWPQTPRFSPISEVSLPFRLLTIPQELFHYFKIILFPKDLAISQHFVIREPTITNFYLPVFLELGIFLLALIIAWKLKSKLMAFGLIWVFVSLLPILNIFPLDMTVAERWLYFPLIGIVIFLAGTIDSLKFTFPRTLACTITLIIVLLLGSRTVIRNSDWKNGLTLYSHDVEISKNSFDLENNLGVELFRVQRYQDAKVRFQNSLTLQPKWHFAHNNLGAVFEQEKNFEQAKIHYLKSLETSDYYLAHENLSALELAYGSPSQAIAYAENALSKLPNNPKLWLTLALAYKTTEEPQKALQAAQKYYTLEPGQKSAKLIRQIEAEQFAR